ncbi:MAG: hypothetical protein IJZ74_10485 [Clostridia bacterium]|nr:hypothetical protein [Clostridia bacterium]
MSALDIFHQDRATRNTGVGIGPRQEYFTALRDALHAELIRSGRSELLENILEEIQAGALTDMYLLDFAALMECHRLIVRRQPLRDTSRHVPYARSARGDKLAWADMRPAGTYLMRVTEDLTRSLQELSSVSAQMVGMRDDTVAPSADSVAQRKFEQAHALNVRLEQQNAELIAERDELRRQLKALQEGYISEQLRYAAEVRRQEMEADLARQYARQREAATEAFRQQFAQELTQMEAQRSEDDQHAAGLLSAVADEYAAVRTCMMSSLQTLQEQIAGQLAGWQHTLWRSESRMLAQCYVSHSGLVGQTMTQLIADAQMMGAPDAMMEQLMQLHSSLHAQLRQLEQAMLRLGLQVVRPAPGTPFDPELHCLAGAVTGEGIASDAVVQQCVRPGVAMVKDGTAACTSLVRAEVTLRR